MRRIAERLGVLCAVVCAAGCNSGQMTQPPPPITVAVAPASVAMAAGATTQFTATVTNDSTNAGVTWSVNGVAGGNSTTGTIDGNGNFTAPAGSASVTITATSKKDASKSANATANAVAKAAACAPTLNPQVCQLTIQPGAAANVSVQFSTDPAYPADPTKTRLTWEQAAPAGGGAVSIFVAGMKANTPYHLRGVVKFADGTTFTDADQTFTTGSIPAAQLPTITINAGTGTPQSGVEFLNLIGGGKLSVAVSDLQGNILWGYVPGSAVPANSNVGPFKLMPNGHILANFAQTNSVGVGVSSVLQEVDLGGNVVWQMTSAELNQALANGTCAECGVTIVATHHDLAILPNGHLILLADTVRSIGGTNVTGDVLIDLDQNHNPVWVWNEFNHLSINRQPYLFPDWTHTNAVIYSKDDKNLIVSIRHQNWLVKINYNDGAGDGSIVWKLGFEGDFNLLDAQGNPDNDGTHWFFAQHGPSFTTDNTTGQFGLTLFDNGDDRGYAVTTPAPGSCGAPQPACFSTVPVMQIDETAKTAKLALNPNTQFPYSFFGGNAEKLQNGNLEYCESATTPGTAGDVYEVTADGSATVVWNMHVTGQFVYRGIRNPSLYPGVQW